MHILKGVRDFFLFHYSFSFPLTVTTKTKMMIMIISRFVQHTLMPLSLYFQYKRTFCRVLLLWQTHQTKQILVWVDGRQKWRKSVSLITMSRTWCWIHIFVIFSFLKLSPKLLSTVIIFLLLSLPGFHILLLIIFPEEMMSCMQEQQKQNWRERRRRHRKRWDDRHAKNIRWQ